MAKVLSVRNVLLTAAVLTAACTVSEIEPPPLTGPSEFGLALSIVALPDTVTRGGDSMSTIVVTARRPDGSPAPNVRLQLSMLINDIVQDFGSLNTRTLFTGSDGKASAVYTAPPPPPPGASPLTEFVTIRAELVGNNQMNTVERQPTVVIRLLLPVINNPNAPVAVFTYSPAQPSVGTLISFNASGSYPVTGTSIVNYKWDWGDGSPIDSTNTLPYEDHDYVAAGTYFVTLTVRDNLGQEGSSTQAVVVQ